MLDTNAENEGEAFYDNNLKIIKCGIPFQLIKFYDKIKDVTPETHFIKISEEETLAIVDCFRSLENKTVDLTKEQAGLIRQIEQKVEALVIEKFKGKSFFTKLFLRSFKDGRSYNKINYKEMYEKEIEIFRSMWNTSNFKRKLSEKDWEENLKLIAGSNIYFKTLRCTNTKEFMNLMLTSTKSYVELEVLLEYGRRAREQGKENDLFENYLSIREWVDMSIINEYRCLIYKNHFICMSQFDTVYYDHLENVENCEEIKKRVVKFWNEKVKEPLSSFESYDVDIAICDDGTITVVELNELENCSAFCMQEEYNKILNGEIDLTDWNEDRVIFRTSDKIQENNEERIKSQEVGFANHDKKENENYDVLLERVESKRSCFIY